MGAAFRVAALACLSLALASATSRPLAAADDPPAVARARALGELLLAAPDEAALGRFVEASWSARLLAERPSAQHLPNLVRLAADLRGGAIEAVRPAGPHEAELVVRAGRLWYVVGVAVEPAPPHGVAGLRVTADSEPPAPPPAEGGPLTEAEAFELLDREIARRVERGEFSGVVAIARGGERRFERAAGIAERTFGTPARLDTRFNIGSIWKMFTAIVVHQLAAEGRLALDAPLAAALPDYPNRDVAARVTPRQLLEHRSGMGDLFDERFRAAPRDRLRTLEDYLALFADRPLEFEPGTGERYSNAGYVVLGLVIEKLTGKRFDEATRERVFAPAGMSETGVFATDEIVPNRATGYTRGRGGLDEPLRANVLDLGGRPSSAGGGSSTAGDLLRFAEAYAAGKLLPPSSERRPGLMNGIAGGTAGANAVLDIGGPGEWSLVVLANLDPPAAMSLSRHARDLLARVR